MRRAIFAAVGLTIAVSSFAAQVPLQPDGGQKQPPLKEQLKTADLVIVGTVTQTGLSAASSFDVGSIQIKETLKGDAKLKTANFRFGSRMVPPYGKKGAEGVWILGKKGGYMEARPVIGFLPLKELKAVKDLLAEEKEKKEAALPPEGAKALKIIAEANWNRSAPSKHMVLRSAAELAKALPPRAAARDQEEFRDIAVKEASKVLKVPTIDWKKQMVVVLHYGKPLEKGQTVRITGLKVEGIRLTIEVELILPGVVPPDKNQEYLTVIALVDRFDGPVDFRVETILLP